MSARTCGRRSTPRIASSDASGALGRFSGGLVGTGRPLHTRPVVTTFGAGRCERAPTTFTPVPSPTHTATTAPANPTRPSRRGCRRRRAVRCRIGSQLTCDHGEWNHRSVVSGGEQSGFTNAPTEHAPPRFDVVLAAMGARPSAGVPTRSTRAARPRVHGHARAHRFDRPVRGAAHFVVRAAAITETRVRPAQTVSQAGAETVLADAAERARTGGDPAASRARRQRAAGRVAGRRALRRDPRRRQSLGAPEEVLPGPADVDGASVAIDAASGSVSATWRHVGSPIGWSVRAPLG